MKVSPLVLALLDALDEPALLVTNGRTEAANRAARALLGSSLVGHDIRFAIRQPQALDAIREGKPGQFEVIGIGGIDRSFELVLTLLEEQLLLVRLKDSSARRAAEKAQIDFVANASHELRTPLATVLGFSETLADDAPLPDEFRRRFGGQIHVQAKRMMEIIRDLMSLSRISADRFTAPSGTIDLAAIIEEAVAAASPLADSRFCVIETSLEQSPFLVTGDDLQLRQLLDNLLANAVRYGCRNEGGRVLVSLSRRSGRAILLVRDWGEGVEALHLPRLTERFYRVDAARSKDGGGTGLGLAIVAQIVERHRGLLHIRSQPGQGTEVEVQLPAAA